MSLSTNQINKLNRMNRAAQDAELGNLLANYPVSGSVAASAAQANASAIIIGTGLGTVQGFIVQGFRSGSPVPFGVSNTSGSLTVQAVTSGSKILANDLYNWIAW